MDGTGSKETITYEKPNSTEVGSKFFKFSVNDDGIYSLTQESALNVKIYKDETGFVTGAKLESIYKGALTAYVGNSLSDYTFKAEDVDLGKNVVVIDKRTATARDADMYKAEITSTSRLASAIAKDDCEVTATIFFDDKEVIFVAVTAVTDAPVKVEE